MGAKGNPAIGAIVLAAGTSTRMGEAKPWLRLGGTTLLERVLATVRASCVAEIVLVLGFAAEKIDELHAGRGVRIVINARYREGMAGSLNAGLAALDPATAAALVVLADQPLVCPETLDRIAGEYRRSRCEIVIPTYKGARGNPVLIDRSLFPEMMALSGDTGARAVFARHMQGTIRVPVEDAGILLDADSPQDLEDLQRLDCAGREERSQLESALLRRRVRPPDPPDLHHPKDPQDRKDQ